MFKLEVETENGAKLKLTQNESRYQIVKIDGLNPPKATINTSKVATINGVKFKSSKLNEREIVLTIKINGDVEQNRLNLYHYFGTGRYCKLYYSNDSRNVYCEGHVETIECDLFVIDETMQISIICENPYLFALKNMTMDISKTFSNFEFPFSIDENGVIFSSFDFHRQAQVVNMGELETGIIISLKAKSDNIQNPIIYNAVTGQFLKLNITVNNGDEIIINTNRGKKSVKKIIDGVVSNAMNTFVAGSTWLSLNAGSNFFTYTADTNEEFLYVDFEYNTLYEGV